MLAALGIVPGRKRILFMVEGSRGDFQPYLALAQGLKEAGYAIRFITNLDHCEACRSAGFDAVGVFTDGVETIRNNKSVKAAMESGDMAKFMECVDSMQRPVFGEVIKKSCVAVEEFKPDLIVTILTCRPFATVLSFHFGIPLVGAYLNMALTPSRFLPSLANEPSWLPGWCHLALHFLIYGMIIKGWEPYREILSTTLPGTDPYMNSSLKHLVNVAHPLLKPIIGASALLLKAPPDLHPDNTPLITGAWIVGAAAQMNIVESGSQFFGSSRDFEGTLAFLKRSSSSPPVCVSWGSMLAVSPEHMARLAVRTLMVLGRRGIIIGGFADLKESMLEGEQELQEYASKSVLFLPAAPHEVLFPKCAAVVHHGGIGTFTAALRAGVPQVITPCLVDQFAQAAKVSNLKVGVGLSKLHTCTVEKLAGALKLVLSDSSFQENAKLCERELRKEDESSVAKAVEEIERDFREEIDTGIWKAKFEARKRLLETSKKAMVEPSCWAWIQRIFFSRSPNDFLTGIQ